MDVAGILSFTFDDVGPIMPKIVRVDGMRTFEVGTPPIGVHPRIFFGPSEIPTIRERLRASPVVGAEAMKQLKVITTSMRLGRAGYNLLPADVRNLPSGRARISNPGLFDTSRTYAELKAGINTIIRNQTTTHFNALAGGMAIEGFYCTIFEGTDPEIPQRGAELALAMDTWAKDAVKNPLFTNKDAARDQIGGQHFAYAYDLAYNFMNDSQRSNCRKAIATMIWLETDFTGINIAPYVTSTNWVTLNSFVPAMVLAIQGEVDPLKDAGWTNSRLDAYFHNIMKANYKFLTYGWYPGGEPYEGMGKNYQYNNMFIAYAKRGYNFFTHPHVQAYAFDFLIAQMQPFGHYITTYDAIGGSGFDPVVGGLRHKEVDIIGLKYGFPHHPAVNLAYRNFVESPYYTSNGGLAVEYSVDVDKVSPRSTYQNSLLSLLIMSPDFEDGDFEAQNAASRNGLTFAGMGRGLMITNSDYTKDALELQFHARQDLGGHTAGDRNNVLLSALGRVFVRLPTGYIYETQWSNGILVNDKGVSITILEGSKARQPSKLAHIQDNALATFFTGDATYAYNTEWHWSPRLPGTGYTRAGFQRSVTVTRNDFRHSDNKIPYSFGNVSFYDYAHWRYGGFLERCIQKQVNDMKQVYRLAGLVRGTYPYTLVVDDLEKLTGGASTNYKSIYQIPEDLTLLPKTNYPINADPVRDVILQEPAKTGNRRLLIRILNAEGSQPSGLFSFNETISYFEFGANRIAKRFIIERVAQKPRFRVMMYPYVEGDAIPQHIVESSGNLVAQWPDQRDTFVFVPQISTVGGETVEITGLVVWRGGQALIDTQNKVEANPIRF